MIKSGCASFDFLTKKFYLAFYFKFRNNKLVEESSNWTDSSTVYIHICVTNTLQKNDVSKGTRIKNYIDNKIAKRIINGQQRDVYQKHHQSSYIPI